MSDNVYVYGVGMIKFGKHLDLGVKQLTGQALNLVLEDCGLEQDSRARGGRCVQEGLA